MPRSQVPVPEKHCQQCGRRLERKRFNGRLEDRGHFIARRFCDQRCMAASMEGKIKVLNPTTSRRQATKTRKKFCSECGTTKGKLDAHHRDENPLNNDPANIVTLCHSCHMKGHWKIWKETTRKPTKCLHCDRNARWNGMCGLHWQRFKRHGDALVTTVWRDGVRVQVREAAPVKASRGRKSSGE